jgi:hypothetical protein
MSFSSGSGQMQKQKHEDKVESWVFSGRFEECGELYKGKCPFV